MFSKQIYCGRRSALKSKMDKGIALFLGNSEAPCNYQDNTYRFRQDSNFLYFFGLDEADLAVVIDFESGEECLYADDADVDSIVWTGPQAPSTEKAASVGIKKAKPSAALGPDLKKARDAGRPIHFTPPYRDHNKILLWKLLGIVPDQQAAAASPELICAIVSMRQIKQAEEIAEMDKACNVGYAMHYTVMKMAKPGIGEQELTGIMEGISVSQGYMPSFPIILSQNGETMHNHAHNQILTPGRLLLVDAGAETENHYASDFTRTFPCSGKFTAQQKDFYNLVLKAQNYAIGLCRPGASFKDIHMATARIITDGLKDLGYMKGDTEEAIAHGAHALFWPTGLGHNLGLDVHDMEDLGEHYVGYDKDTERSKQFGLKSLRMSKGLMPGMIITVEPGIYFIPVLIDQWRRAGTNKDFVNFQKLDSLYTFGGIRIEDDVLITPDGYRLVGSKRLPVTVEEIEAVMK